MRAVAEGSTGPSDTRSILASAWWAMVNFVESGKAVHHREHRGHRGEGRVQERKADETRRTRRARRKAGERVKG